MSECVASNKQVLSINQCACVCMTLCLTRSCSEPAEITAIIRNIDQLHTTISHALTSFSGRFQELGFITSEESSEALGRTQVSDLERARLLLKCVIDNLRNMAAASKRREWLDGFISIFSPLPPHQELASSLTTQYQEGTVFPG